MRADEPKRPPTAESALPPWIQETGDPVTSPPTKATRASVAAKGPSGMEKATVAAFIAIAGGALVLSVVRDALVGWNYGAVPLKWSSDPGVFRTELILAGCAASVTLVSLWMTARSNRATGQIVMWFGLGILGLGILSFAVGQTGFQVVAPIDALERQELIYALLGVIGAVIGGLMAFIGAVFMKGIVD